MSETLPTASPLVYVALSSDLIAELELDAQLERLTSVARIERWDGEGKSGEATIIDALVCIALDL